MGLKSNSKIDAFKLAETFLAMKVNVFLDPQCKNFISLIENLTFSTKNAVKTMNRLLFCRYPLDLSYNSSKL